MGWGVQHMNYWERLRSLNIMSLQRRSERYMNHHIFKILHSICSNNLNIQLLHHPCSELRLLFQTASQRNQTLHDKSFAVLGQRLWNTIPTELTQVGFRQQFTNSLINYLILIPDKSPVLGHCCPNNNSLLSWVKTVQTTEAQLLRWSLYVIVC